MFKLACTFGPAVQCKSTDTDTVSSAVQSTKVLWDSWKSKVKKNFGASQGLDWHYMPPCTTEAIPLKDIDMIMKYRHHQSVYTMKNKQSLHSGGQTWKTSLTVLPSPIPTPAWPHSADVSAAVHCRQWHSCPCSSLQHVYDWSWVRLDYSLVMSGSKQLVCTCTCRFMADSLCRNTHMCEYSKPATLCGACSGLTHGSVTQPVKQGMVWKH